MCGFTQFCKISVTILYQVISICKELCMVWLKSAGYEINENTSDIYWTSLLYGKRDFN